MNNHGSLVDGVWLAGGRLPLAGWFGYWRGGWTNCWKLQLVDSAKGAEIDTPAASTLQQVYCRQARRAWRCGQGKGAHPVQRQAVPVEHDANGIFKQSLSLSCAPRNTDERQTDRHLGLRHVFTPGASKQRQRQVHAEAFTLNMYIWGNGLEGARTRWSTGGQHVLLVVAAPHVHSSEETGRIEWRRRREDTSCRS